MRRSSLHTVEVHLTRNECRRLHEIAQLRGQSTGELVREALRLGPLERAAKMEVAQRFSTRHLSAVPSLPSDGAGGPRCA